MPRSPEDPVIGVILDRLTQLDTRLEGVGALVARIYDQQQGWSDRLRQLRALPEYDAAFVERPMVSVITATFEGMDTLRARTIPSVLSQSYANWEMIIVGDATTDDTASVVAGFGDDRIRFENRAFRGPYPTDPVQRWYVAGIPPWNDATSMARGKWLAPLDHDDEWFPDHLDTLLRRALADRAELVYSRIDVVHAQTGELLETMGQYPPTRGQFGLLSSIRHHLLSAFPMDMNCRFADEPGDWNLARRLWDAGVRFSFVDQILARAHFLPKVTADRTTEGLLWAGVKEAQAYFEEQVERLTSEVARRDSALEELRAYLVEVEKARDHWRERFETSEKR